MAGHGIVKQNVCNPAEGSFLTATSPGFHSRSSLMYHKSPCEINGDRCYSCCTQIYRFIQVGSPLDVAAVCRGEGVLVKLLQDRYSCTLQGGFSLPC